MSPSAAPAHAVLPDVIAFRPGRQREGIAKGGETTMFSASIASGDVLAVDVLTGESHLAVDAPPGHTAAGLEQDRWDRLWVAGGPTGQAYVYGVDGIEATAGDHWLVAVQSNTGILYRIDPATGGTTAIDLGGASLVNGDGLLLQGHRLYVVQDFFNKSAWSTSTPGAFTWGTVVGELTSANFDIPTTIASLGNRLYLINSRFSTPPTPTTPYAKVALQRR